ncbi:hypothetical protein NDU88_002034 [Pleurodeles waltl]|uniref:Uncharacterized protein n=1 Tax=Pleurodeles waltl TaxID=8319 RepID=A0AAV7VBU0_PLEWA|nr:hypothetical protein NDU88_002034 [Pleurodeles waltl]
MPTKKTGRGGGQGDERIGNAYEEYRGERDAKVKQEEEANICKMKGDTSQVLRQIPEESTTCTVSRARKQMPLWRLETQARSVRRS